MRIILPVGQFPTYAFCALCALSALSVSGCFGGDGDTSTTGPENPRDSTATRKIVPGLYVSDYSWIDTSSFAGMQAEFLMDADGAFKHIFIYRDQAIFDHSGRWEQSGGNLIFTGILYSESEGGVFFFSDPVDDDTNSVRDVTDSGFTRMEWTPLRQKPYWIAYKRKTDFPQLSEGDYYRHVIDTFTVVADTADTTGAVDTVKVVDNLYRFKIGGGDSLLYSATVDTLETYQLDATYRQIGSFLITEKHRDRVRDTTNAFGEWLPIDGFIILKLKEVSDTAFVLQTPAYSPEPNGFLSYSKNGK